MTAIAKTREGGCQTPYTRLTPDVSVARREELPAIFYRTSGLSNRLVDANRRRKLAGD